jgi:hypothetical protein
MRRTPWILCLWPGLPQVWSHGSWPGLAVALGAAGVLDLWLLVSFGWSELIGSSGRSIGWVAFAVAWLAAAGFSIRLHRRQLAMAQANHGRDPYVEALDHYLKGDYYQAERLWEGLLRRNGRDLDARLMLATLLRRSGRIDEAVRHLDVLECLEGAGKWSFEIQGERRRLTEAKNRTTAAA